MKNKLAFIVVSLFTLFVSKAQNAPIMVCNPAGSTCTPYTTIDLAYAGANVGDYIYLPGGTFTLTQPIGKELHLIGAGITNIGTVATGFTKLNYTKVLAASANSTFEGIDFYDFRYQETTSNLTFIRCKFESTFTSVNSVSLNNSTFLNCIVLTGLNLSYDVNYPAINNSIYNSIFIGTFIACSRYSIFKNNIFLNFGNSQNFVDAYCSNSMLINNCLVNSFISGNSSSTFINNFYGNSTDFVNVPNITVYSDSYDYHITTTSAAHNAGNDGTDAGIYGGDYPWKEMAIPTNPHIQLKNIGTSTDTSGNLPVHITVSSQN